MEDKTILKSKAHPNHYLIHKYWSRKPHNIVNYYINKYTNENQVVFDPYMGSGVVILESLKLKRKTIGIDLNPISYFLTNIMIRSVNVEQLKKEFKNIFTSLYDINQFYYKTYCLNCKKQAIIDTSLVKESVICSFCNHDNYLIESKRIGTKYFCAKCDKPLKRVNNYIKYNYTKIKGYCKNCGYFIKDYEEQDLELIKKANNEFQILRSKKGKWVPIKKIEESIRRAGKERLFELFSERNLIVINHLFDKINLVENQEIKNCLLLTLTASLSNMSRMIPADEKNMRGKSGWQIPKYYIFPSHIEKNVLFAYKQRFNSNLKGWEEIARMDINRKDALLFNRSSKNLKFIENESVDYIFTDPPYGKTIQYLPLSDLWNSILNFNIKFEEEIIWDTKRNKNLNKYYEDLNSVFKECYNVLKNERYMSLTFNARDLRLLRILIISCLDAGFTLKEVKHQEFAVSSATQGLNWRNTLKGDFIFTFKKENIKGKKTHNPVKGDLKSRLIKEIKDILKIKKFLEFGDLYALLIPILVKKGFFCDKQIERINIDDILELNFKKKTNSKIFWYC